MFATAHVTCAPVHDPVATAMPPKANAALTGLAQGVHGKVMSANTAAQAQAPGELEQTFHRLFTPLISIENRITMKLLECPTRRKNCG